VTLGHFFYIPGVLLLGVVIGYVLGGRAIAAAAGDRAELERRQAARRAREAAREGAEGPR